MPEQDDRLQISMFWAMSPADPSGAQACGSGPLKNQTQTFTAGLLRIRSIRHANSSLLVLLALSNDYSVQELDYTHGYDAHSGGRDSGRFGILMSTQKWECELFI
ncbi:hypothetical protein IFM47457_06733 [Aspergillus lentulus]|nr:hypothetical protein IFM47457_06733 [Aspergillus lentulus]